MDDCNHSGKKSPQMIEWTAQVAPLLEASTVKKINDRSLLLSLNKITQYFKRWTTGSGALKKIYCLYKKVMLQIDPLKSSCSLLSLKAEIWYFY